MLTDEELLKMRASSNGQVRRLLAEIEALQAENEQLREVRREILAQYDVAGRLGIPFGLIRAIEAARGTQDV